MAIVLVLFLSSSNTHPLVWFHLRFVCSGNRWNSHEQNIVVKISYKKKVLFCRTEKVQELLKYLRTWEKSNSWKSWLHSVCDEANEHSTVFGIIFGFHFSFSHSILCLTFNFYLKLKSVLADALFELVTRSPFTSNRDGEYKKVVFVVLASRYTIVCLFNFHLDIFSHYFNHLCRFSSLVK